MLVLQVCDQNMGLLILLSSSHVHDNWLLMSSLHEKPMKISRIHILSPFLMLQRKSTSLSYDLSKSLHFIIDFFLFTITTYDFYKLTYVPTRKSFGSSLLQQFCALWNSLTVITFHTIFLTRRTSRDIFSLSTRFSFLATDSTKI